MSSNRVLSARHIGVLSLQNSRGTMVRRICSTASCRGSGSHRDQWAISSFIAGLYRNDPSQIHRDGRVRADSEHRPAARARLSSARADEHILAWHGYPCRKDPHGIYATVHNHTEWETLADQAAAAYRAGKEGPIIIIGHSLGADAVMQMSAYLGRKGVPVALAVPFDARGSYATSSNVGRLLNRAPSP